MRRVARGGTNLFSALPMTLLSLAPISVQTIKPALLGLPASWTARLTGGYTPDEMASRVDPVFSQMDSVLTRQAEIRSPLYDYFMRLRILITAR